MWHHPQLIHKNLRYRKLRPGAPEPDEVTRGMARVVHFALLLMVGMSLFPAEAMAQGETTSAIVGQVSDATHAVVPEATVSVTNRETGATRKAKSDDSGWFSFPQLKPGSYSVRVDAAGFES